MSLLDRAQAATADRRPGPLCTVAQFPDDIRDDVEATLELVDHRDLTYTGLAQAIWEEHELKVGYQSLSRHHKRGTSGGCSCGAS